MIKLQQLYEAVDKDINIVTTKIGEDPETQSTEWDVRYEPKPIVTYEFKNSYKELDNFVKQLIKLNGRQKPIDPNLEDLVFIAKNLRNRYHRYLEAYQPDWNQK